MFGSATDQVSQPSLGPLAAFQTPLVPVGLARDLVVLGRGGIARIDHDLLEVMVEERVRLDEPRAGADVLAGVATRIGQGRPVGPAGRAGLDEEEVPA